MIRIVLAVFDSVVPQWQFMLLERIVRDHRFTIGFVIEQARDTRAARFPAHQRSGFPSWDSIDTAERRLSFALWGKKRYRIDPDLLRNLSELGADWTTLHGFAAPGSGENVATVGSEDLTMLARYEPDVILALGGQRLHHDLLRTARLGAWFFDQMEAHHDVLGFREVLANDPVTEVRLLSETNGRKPAVLCTGVYKTFEFSWNENRRRARTKSLWLMLDALGRIAGPVAQPDLAGLPDARADPRRISPPSVLQALRAIAKQLSRAGLREVMSLVTREQWQLLVTDRSDAGPATLIHFIPPGDRFWADPFVATDLGNTYVFAEEYLYSEGKGNIVCLPVAPTPKACPTPVLSLPCHLSYPFLFRHDDRLYMIPESHQNLSIDLWECREFPLVWAKVRTMLSGVSAVDTSVIEHEGRWWLFTNIDRSGLCDHTSELHIYFSSDPVSGEWTPHPGNPVVVDCRRARMAGGFIRHRDGRLVRMAQCTARYYGEALVYCEVRKLTPDAYEEHVLKIVRPSIIGSALCAHHLSTTEGFRARDELIQSRAWLPKRRGAIRRLPCPTEMSIG